MDNQEFDRWFLKTLKPNERLTLDEWSDKYRLLSSKSSAEPGKYRTTRTPYLRAIMRDLSVDSPVEMVVFEKASQIGASEILNNWVGYVIDHCPAPMMIVLPNVDLAKRNSKTRIEPMIDECPQLMNKVHEKKSRDSSNTILQKEFAGGLLIMSGANSAVSLRSTPIRFLGLDEVDGYKADVDGEGSPIKLAIARTRTFSKKKIYMPSTPTVEGSVIDTEFQKTDKRYYFVPCLGCGHYQVITWKQIKWDNNDPSTARFECEKCSHIHTDLNKTELLELGDWKVTEPKNRSRKKKGYHLSALYSPYGWYSWKEAVKDYLEAKKDINELKAWTNTVLGEVWLDEVERPDWERLYQRRESYPIGKVPDNALMLTAGVDVQGDRIEIEVVGWGPNKASWSVDYRVFVGDISNEAVWNDLESYINMAFPRSSDERFGVPITLTAIDSGFATQTVYNFVRKQNPRRVIAIKGRAKQPAIFQQPKYVDVNTRDKKIKRGLKVYSVGVDTIKEEIYTWLKLPRSDSGTEPYGYCHFPEYGEEYFKQLTAEQVVRKYVRGYKISEWQKKRERNEAIDCRTYARAAFAIKGGDRFRDDKWQQLAAESRPISAQKKEETAVISLSPKPTEKQQQQPRLKRRSTWL